MCVALTIFAAIGNAADIPGTVRLANQDATASTISVMRAAEHRKNVFDERRARFERGHSQNAARYAANPSAPRATEDGAARTPVPR